MVMCVYVVGIGVVDVVGVGCSVVWLCWDVFKCDFILVDGCVIDVGLVDLCMVLEG